MASTTTAVSSLSSSSSSSSPSKMMTLSELRVFELKQELEKRGLDKSGIKLALVERLEGALREEGHDPKTYKFVINDYGRSVTPSKSTSSEILKEDASFEHETKVANGHDDNEQPEIKKESESEHITAVSVVIESEDKDDETEKSSILGISNESSEEMKMDEMRMEQNNGNEGSTAVEQENHGKNEVIGEQMELNEVVVEENAVVKEDVEHKIRELEGTVKEVAEEVNYEDEEMSDAARIHEEEKETGENKGARAESTERVDKSKMTEENLEKGQGKIVKEGDNSFTSTVETVASTPAESVENATHGTTTVLKKTDCSLWIKGISPNTKAADLKALFAKYGRVLTAKIFTRRQQPSSACFGFVTMSDAAAADLCIQKLHKTTIKGRPITVERADRCNMPIVKSIPKKTQSNAAAAGAGAAAGDTKSGKFPSMADSSSGSKSSDEKSSNTKGTEKSKKDTSSIDKTKSSSSSGGDKSGSATRSEKQKTVKAVSETKKSPIKAPSASITHSRFPAPSSSKRPQPSRFRAGKRIERMDRVSSTLRRSYVIHKPSYSSAASRRSLGSRQFSSRLGRGGMLRGSIRREVSSRRVEPPTSWEKREMMEMLRKKEEEHRLKEQELRLQRERERLKFERERFERERLELQQLRQIAALTAPVQMMPAPGAPPPRRAHEYGDVDSSRYKTEKELKRSEYSRRSGERSSSHRGVTSVSRNSLPDRREQHSSSRHISSTHTSSRSAVERNRERSRDRSRHGTRDYGSSGVVRENVTSYGRDSHSYSRGGDPALSSSYGRDSYRPDSTTYSSHRSADAGYGNRDVGTYSSSSTYSRDIAPSSYNKDSGYGSSSRSLGTGASWSVGGGSSSTYVGSSRDYDSSAWISGVSSSQSHGSHGLANSNWSSSRDDHWSGSGIAGTHGHVSSYDKYDKYDSYDKYSRRY